MNQRVLKASLSLALLASVGVTSMGCVVDPDPGVCYTQGKFRNIDVSEDYVRQNCEDWVYLLLSNCVEVDGLPLAPTAGEISTYCYANINGDNWGGTEYPPAPADADYSGFVIGHTCNFIDNPSYECTGFAARGSVSQDAAFGQIFETQSKKAPQGEFTRGLPKASLSR